MVREHALCRAVLPRRSAWAHFCQLVGKRQLLFHSIRLKSIPGFIVAVDSLKTLHWEGKYTSPVWMGS